MFLRTPGRAGPFGALLDESARAAEDFCRVLERFPQAEYEAERPGGDPDTVSVRAIAAHVCGAARRYADYIRKARGMPHVERYLPPPGTPARPSDARAMLAEALRYTEEALEGLWDAPYEAVRALEFRVRWGPSYDPEMILEHGVCHFLRHRRQLERWGNA